MDDAWLCHCLRESQFQRGISALVPGDSQGGAVPRAIGHSAARLASIHWTPAAPHLQHGDQKCLQTLPLGGRVTVLTPFENHCRKSPVCHL